MSLFEYCQLWSFLTLKWFKIEAYSHLCRCCPWKALGVAHSSNCSLSIWQPWVLPTHLFWHFCCYTSDVMHFLASFGWKWPKLLPLLLWNLFETIVVELLSYDNFVLAFLGVIQERHCTSLPRRCVVSSFWQETSRSAGVCVGNCQPVQCHLVPRHRNSP